MADTKNVLSNFDLCLSLSQMAINSQLKDAWNTWSDAFNDGDDVVLQTKDGSADVNISMEVDAPSISLDGGEADQGRVLVHLPINKGMAKRRQASAHVDLTGMIVAFYADLRTKPVSSSELAEFDAQSRKDLEEILSSVPEDRRSGFTIEGLFLDFMDYDRRAGEIRLLDATEKAFESDLTPMIVSGIRDLLSIEEYGPVRLGMLVHQRDCLSPQRDFVADPFRSLHKVERLRRPRKFSRLFWGL